MDACILRRTSPIPPPMDIRSDTGTALRRSSCARDPVGLHERGVRSLPGGGVRPPPSPLTARYRLLAGGQRLSVTFTWEDPLVFQKPHTYEFRYYKIRQISEPRVYNCNPNDAERAEFLLNER